MRSCILRRRRLYGRLSSPGPERRKRGDLRGVRRADRLPRCREEKCATGNPLRWVTAPLLSVHLGDGVGEYRGRPKMRSASGFTQVKEVLMGVRGAPGGAPRIGVTAGSRSCATTEPAKTFHYQIGRA